jgi:DNA-binding transcriptional ArsR family regulator
MDKIFKALNDPARRALLDSLRQRDGQTLTELEDQLDMTRFGVMKHLKVLEEAHLIVTRKEGRFKHHYLNALPLQEMLDRWVAPFLQPQARALSDLKSRLERQTDMGKPDFLMQTFIRCSQDALWDALTRADQIAAYHFMCNEVHGDARPGNVTRFVRPDGVRHAPADDDRDGPQVPHCHDLRAPVVRRGRARVAHGLPDRAAGGGLQTHDRALRHRAGTGRLWPRAGPVWRPRSNPTSKPEPR